MKSKALAISRPVRRVAWPAAFVLVLALIAWLYLRGVTTYLSPGSDEGIYVSQAWSVLHGSLQPYSYWYDHPPLGWVQLAAFLAVPFKLWPHVQAVMLGRYVMVGYALVDAALIYVIARRVGVNRFFALLAMVGLLSPLAVSEFRQVLLDGLTLPWLLGAFALTLSPRRHLWQYFASGICFAFAVLTKETVLLLLPALLYALWVSADRRLRFMAIVVQITSFVVSVGAYPLFATLRHELLPGAGHVSLWGAVMWQLGDRAGSGAVWTPGSVRYDLVAQWMGVDQFLIAAGLVAAAICLFSKHLRFLAVALLAMALPVVKPGGYLPGMYVTVALPFMALAVAGVLDWAWSQDLAGLTRRVTSVKTVLRGLGGWTALAASTATVVVFGTVVAPAWGASPVERAGVDAGSPSEQVESWLKTNVGRDQVVLADASYYVDLIDAGWPGPWGVVWYTQLDLDTSAAAELPRGWRSADYVVESRQVERDITSTPLPQLGEAIANGRVVAQYGTGEDTVRIIQVLG